MEVLTTYWRQLYKETVSQKLASFQLGCFCSAVVDVLRFEDFGKCSVSKRQLEKAFATIAERRGKWFQTEEDKAVHIFETSKTPRRKMIRWLRAGLFSQPARSEWVVFPHKNMGGLMQVVWSMSLARRVTVAQRHVSQAYIKESRPKWLQLLLDVSASRPIRNTKVFDVSVNQNIFLLQGFCYILSPDSPGEGTREEAQRPGRGEGQAEGEGPGPEAQGEEGEPQSPRERHLRRRG